MFVMVPSSMVSTSTLDRRPSPTLWAAGDQAQSQATVRAAHRMAAEAQSILPQHREVNREIGNFESHFASGFLESI